MDYEGNRDTDTEIALGDTALTNPALARALPELAAAASAAARTGGTPLVPDANNTVVLPEGASLDDITVRGRDLVIQTDDGRIYVIADGAIFVPQIVAQGVTVPPLNLAALLIGHEPEPAAGAVRSSGGNFAVPVGSIQDAYKIGDLLPYTELKFPEPRIREIVPGIDRKPITGPNADVLLDDDALKGGNAGGTGDDADSANTAGTLVGSGGDGALTWSLSTAGAPSGFSYVANGTGIDVFQGAVRVLTVTLDTATGAYTVTQLAPIVHVAGGDENNQIFALTYTVTDIDGDTASGTLGINVDDDTPLANPDTDTVAAGTYGPETGNVLTGAGTTSGAAGADHVGADGPAAGGALVAISGFGGAGTIGGTTVGHYGTLTLGADGSYSYVRNPGTPGGVTDTFTYTIRDGDGDNATTTLTINIGDAQPLTGENATVLLDDDALANGNAGGTGDTADAANLAGTLSAAGGDGPLAWSLSTAGAPAGFSYVANGTGIDVLQGSTLVMQVTLNPATGAYTVTQVAPIDHAAGGDENNQPFNIGYTVTDQDSDAATGTLSISVNDDTPLAANDTDTVASGTYGPETGNVLTGVGTTSGAAGADSIGADGPAASGAVTAISGFGGAGAIAGVTHGQYGDLTLNADGSYSYVRNAGTAGGVNDTFTYTVTDHDGDTTTATLVISIEDARPFVGPNQAVLLDDDVFAGGNPGGTGDDVDGANTSGTLAASGGDGALAWAMTSFSSPGGFSASLVTPSLLEIRQGSTLVMQITLNTATGAYTVTQVAPIDHAAGLDENNTGFTLGYRVTDADGDQATGTLAINIDDDTPVAVNDTDALLAGATTASGNVLTGLGSDGDPAGADSIGADGPATGGAVTAITGFGGAGAIGGTTTGQYGTLTLNADGSYSYVRASGTPGNVADTFTYTITDHDGDTATATLVITIEDARPVTGPNALVQLDDDALAGGNPGGTGDDPNAVNLTGTLSGSGGDGALAWSLFSFTSPVGYVPTLVNPGLLEIRQGGTLVFTITLNTATGAYSVTQVAPINHPAGNDENNVGFSLGYQVTDADGDQATGTLAINIDDDTPTVSGTGAVPNLTVDETVFATNSTQNLSGVFTHSFGADGAAVGGGVAYTLGAVAGPSGLIDTLSGEAVNLVMNGGVVEGRTATGGLLVFTVTVDASGNVTLDQSRAVVHDPNLGPNDVETLAANLVTLTQTVTDRDGDSASAAAGIGDHLQFVDDAPGAGSNLTVFLNDDALANGNVGGSGDTGAVQFTTGTLSHTYGNDGGSIAFLTTGAPAGFQYVAAGSNILVQQNQGGSFVTVATVTLNSASGAYTVTQNAPVLHPTSGTIEENLSLTLNYVVTDGDGDQAPSSLVIVFNDDTPLAVNDVDSVTEDGAIVADGNVYTGSGGSDANATDGARDSIGADGAALGGAVTAIAFGATTGTLGSALAGTYGALTLNADGSYSYALNNASAAVQALDSGETRTDVFTYTITDRDGDSTTATLTITINGTNDAPVVTPSTTAVSEEGLALANPDAVGNTDTTNSASVNGTIVATDVDVEPLTYTLGTPATALTSGGVAVTWSGSGTGTLTGSAGANPIITVTINSSGGYTVTLLGHIDHPSTTTEDSLSLVVPVNVSDGTATTPTTLTVSIEDDSPIATTGTTSGSVDEDGLSGGIAGGTGDLAGQATVATGSVVGLFSGGADTAPQYLLTTTAGLPALTSGGVAINYALVGNVLTATAGATPIFTLSLNSATGGWTFTLQGPIDHATGANENDLVLNFAGIVQAVDADGDRASAAGTFSVTIDDDTPVANNDGTTQSAENAPVTIDVFTNDQGGADGALVSSVAVVGGSLTGTGSLLNNGNGTFTYTPGAGEQGTVTFAYTITDRDGDTSQATATITLLADSVPQVVNVVASVDDDGLTDPLAPSNPASTVNDIDANIGDLNGAASSEASFRGQLTVNFGGDTGTVSFANLGGTTGTVGTETVSYAWNALTNTLTATGPRGPLFSVSLTPSGSYTVTLLDNVLHAAGGAEASAPVVNLNYVATDSDGDSNATGVLAITFNDDAPTASASATQPQLTVDETVLATNATASFAGVFTTAFGADGAAAGGGTAYALGVAAGATGLVDTLTGEAVNLAMNGTTVEGRSATTNQLVFTVTVDGSGNVTLDQQRAVMHTPDSGPNQSVSLASDGLVTLTATVTDGDGDTASAVASIGQNLTFLDDAPAITAATTPLAILNSGTVSNTGTFAFTTGSDGPATGNDAIRDVTFTATVNGSPVASPTITAGAETATTATYSFSFVYATGTASTATETGTIVFDKVAGTYTVDLANPIQGISTTGTANGQAFIGYAPNSAATDNTSPEVAVTQISSNLFVQFTSIAEPGSGTGANNLQTVNYGLDATPPNDGAALTFSNGELFNQASSWVSVSNSANGVGGDTIGKGEVLDFNLFNSNPQGFLGTTPTANADGMYLKFDGIGAAEDLIVVLKLFDTVTGEYTTRALLVQNSDIQKGPGTGPGIYAGITLDNNDGLIVIESNDYNTASSHYVIIGAQIAASDEGISGNAYNFSNTMGAGGGSTGSTQTFATDTNDNPIKISDIGFVVTTVTAQTAQLTFNVTVQDADGDTANQTLVVNVGSAPPVAIDLNGDGVQYLSAAAGVAFDYNGDGTAERTAWVDAHDGLLAIDSNHSGSVDSGSEIVFGGNGLTDLQGLAASYDSNHDGVLDAQDAAFAQFGVWQDANSNGVSDAGEFKSLTELGIASLNLTSDGQASTAAGGDVTVFGSTTYTRADGTTGTAADVAFATSALQRQAQPAELAAVSAAATGLLAAMALDHANAAADTGLRTAAAHSADLPAAAAPISVDLPETAAQPAFAQLAALASAKQAAVAEFRAGHAEAAHDQAELGRIVDHAVKADNAAQTAGKSALFAAHDGGHAAMDALLTVAAQAPAKAAAAAQPVVAEALSDAAGNHAVDHIVDHFAATTATQLGASPKAGDFALQGLLDSSVQGSGHDAGAPHFNLMQALDHEQAAALA
ncbi:MAG: DUF5801 repeats-in-toxin domain-containing protein [Novosphingobium sp.]